METVLGTLDIGTPDEVTYVQDEDGSVYERRPSQPDRSYCSQKLWPNTRACAALAMQDQQIDLLTYHMQQHSLH